MKNLVCWIKVLPKVENEVKEQEGQFHETLAAALVANVLTNMLGNTIMPGPVLIRAGEGTIRAGKDL